MLLGIGVMMFGALGGVVNCWLVDEGFLQPRWVQRSPDERLWHPGWIGNVFTGAIAALVTYCLVTGGLASSKQLGLSILSGLGGGNVLMSYYQRWTQETLKARIKTLEDTLLEKVTPQPPTGAVR